MGMSFVAECGNAGQDGAEDGLRQWHIERILRVGPDWTNVAVAVLKVDAELVRPAEEQQVID